MRNHSIIIKYHQTNILHCWCWKLSNPDMVIFWKWIGVLEIFFEELHAFDNYIKNEIWESSKVFFSWRKHEMGHWDSWCNSCRWLDFYEISNGKTIEIRRYKFSEMKRTIFQFWIWIILAYFVKKMAWRFMIWRYMF